jgi:aspartyl-tRNA(Asn)/glutamyl-tRNA(Gln) amidotransferase subunit A
LDCPEIRANFEKSVAVMSRFADITSDVDFPDFPYGAIISTILYSEGAAAFRELIDTGRMREMQNPADRIGGYIGYTISAVDYLRAQRVRKPARRALEELLGKYDAVIAPSAGAVARRVEENFNRPTTPDRTRQPGPEAPSLVQAGNIAGMPGLTVPNGFGQHDLPTGVQFLGAAWSETTLLAIANAYQHQTDWHKRRPPAI